MKIKVKATLVMRPTYFLGAGAATVDEEDELCPLKTFVNYCVGIRNKNFFN
jgi:hypothetical protein